MSTRTLIGLLPACILQNELVYEGLCEPATVAAEKHELAAHQLLAGTSQQPALLHKPEYKHLK